MKVQIYTTPTCIYCNLAKKLLKDKNIEYTEVNLEEDFNKLKELIKVTKHKTVPQIFIDDTFIGGYTELKELLK